jgi:hypothetical protein
LALKVLIGLPFDLLGVLQALDWSPQASMLAVALALIVAVGVSLRLTVLFPALAVEAPGATPSHALADSKGHVLRLLALFFWRWRRGLLRKSVVFPYWAGGR